MRLNFFITCASLCALSIIIAFVLTIIIPPPAPIKQPSTAFTQNEVENIPRSSQANNSNNSNNASASYDYEYMLKDYNGRLAVYFKNEPNPQKIFDVYLTTLPSYDRGQLKQGVPAKSYEQLLALIEDYTS